MCSFSDRCKFLVPRNIRTMNISPDGSSDARRSLLPQDRRNDDGERPSWRRRWVSRETEEEVKTQVLFAIPMVLTNVSYYVIPLISVMFAGHIGDLELAAATLANSWTVVTGFALAIGLSGALETLCGQNYGAKLYRMLGIHLQSLLIITSFASILVSVLWVFSDRVLSVLGQDPQISKMAAIYLTYLIPGLFAYGFLQCMLRFLQTQSIVVPLIFCSVAPVILHIGIAYVVVHVLALGFKGAALATSISLWISVAMLATYIKFSRNFRYTWEGFSMESLAHVLPNMRLAIPSAVMVCLEFWAFELLVLLAGLMPNSKVSTPLVAMCVSTEAVIYNISYGFSAAVSTRTSNELGAGKSEKAKKAVKVNLVLSFGAVALFILLLCILHDTWANSFSDSAVIIDAFAAMTPLLAASLLLDSVQAILSGVARGCGWQHKVAWINLGAFYVIGMPLSLLFGFLLGLHYEGLWMGMVIGLFCQSSILLFITLRIKWSDLELFVDEKENVLV